MDNIRGLALQFPGQGGLVDSQHFIYQGLNRLSSDQTVVGSRSPDSCARSATNARNSSIRPLAFLSHFRDVNCCLFKFLRVKPDMG